MSEIEIMNMFYFNRKLKSKISLIHFALFRYDYYFVMKLKVYKILLIPDEYTLCLQCIKY